jgi:histidyl-tRNA synthetase
MSGVGISFGLDRIYLLRRVNLFPKTVTATSKALFINYGDEAFYAMQQLKDCELLV